MVIAYLLNSDPSKVAAVNNISDSTQSLQTPKSSSPSTAPVPLPASPVLQSMIDQNIYDSRHLEVGMRLTVPLRCECPIRRQLNGGVRHLLSYLITWGDTVGDIARRFRADERATLEANLLSPDYLIYPFTPLLVPMKSAPTKDERQGGRVVHEEVTFNDSVAPAEAADTMFSEEIRGAIGTVYKYEDLERATGFFDEEHRIKGSVFKGVINGDHAAIKRTKGDVLNEIDEGLKVTRRVVGTQGYMAPEYVEHRLITPKMDVFAYGVVLLELLSGKEAAAMTPKEEFLMFWESMEEGFLEGKDVREKIEGFVDLCLENDYPFELAFALVQLTTRGA
ncbi:Protein LYK5 [Acorus calamus]|uniref:Protein LYK5 n=1 Tax=Acorus calamus TaxID=4465 RepID=A0AAV9CDM8_ACOCL|nr:Protein LYK5 [Acorus calamus]